jgi:urea transport system substrate-binding protein
MKMTLFNITLFCILLGILFSSCSQQKESIKVGVLHSLSGTMAISETDVKNATLMAIEEINAQGGLLGRQIEAIVVDGKSDWGVFANLADSLISRAKVEVVFGCWTSASRKTVRPIFEKYNHLLFYPIQYEGVEQSPNIVYTGAAPNQQIIPAVKWSFDNHGKKFFLVGSDYVFPRTANEIIKEQVKGLRGQILGEEYIKLGSKDVHKAVARIVETKPDVILNTINGDTNIEFFKELRKAGITPQMIPTMSFSIAEAELQSMNIKQMVGDYTAWNYFQSIKSPNNEAFVNRFRNKYGKDKVTDDPIEAGYFGVYLWAEAVKQAGESNPMMVRTNLAEQSYQAPEGLVYIDGSTQHTWKPVRIGQIREDGQFDIVWDSEQPVRPIPFPNYHTKAEWDLFLYQLYKNWKNNWANLE